MIIPCMTAGARAQISARMGRSSRRARTVVQEHMANGSRITCAHEVRLDEQGILSATGAVTGCVVLFAGLQKAVPSIREAALVYRCRSSHRGECPFSKRNLWLRCPGYSPPQ